MDIEKLKKEFIKLKSEELEYLDNIAKLGYQKTFSQEEKLNIYRKLKFMKMKMLNFIKFFLIFYIKVKKKIWTKYLLKLN